TSLAASGERFDIVIADPPPFARSKKEVPAGVRGYRKMARLGGGITAPGGVLFLSPCFYNFSAAGFPAQVRAGTAEARGGAPAASCAAPGQARTIRFIRRCRKRPI